MGKVYSLGSYRGSGKTPPGISSSTLDAFYAQRHMGYLVESPHYDLEVVLSRFLATVEPYSEENRHKVIVVAPPLGPFDFSGGALVSFANIHPSPSRPGDPFLANIYSQLQEGTWIELRALWEIAIHEFIAPLDSDNPGEDVDDVIFGNFWLDGKADFQERFREKNLSKGLKLIKTSGSPFEPIQYVDSSELIFGWIHWSVLAYHRVIPEPLAELTRAQVAEFVQTRNYIDVSKRATRDQKIRDEIAKLKPGFYKKSRHAMAKELEALGDTRFVGLGMRHDGSYNISY